ncbi:thiamine transport system ATP-binding protein [Palleronia aestuarii]|uniref:Thiamine transport system ATP-binding protein n=1 Tax=Palleronia aestuarii TaxID=568105 RepID=A0A2W7NQX7_9RHOB|nr:ATP-binding cassette domain-containing protein [Palleronia aestuarii]PZX19034.1 thiamine transport system ATP-binding protein [Palleronia aestuarii]
MLTLDAVEIARGAFCLRADFVIPGGALVALIGASGAGKSTLLEAIGGFVPISGGSIYWSGADITREPPDRRPVATLFQDNNLFPHLTVSANMALGLTLRRRPSAADRKQVTEMLERVGLDGLGDRKPGALSGGQRSRVALARAVLQNRPLLLLDEPFAALGPALKAEMIGLVVGLARERGKTLMMITHDPQDAHLLGDQTILIADGRAEEPADTKRLFSAPPPSLASYLGT